MNAVTVNSEEMLERLALQHIADNAERSERHASRVCFLPKSSWQADVLKRSLAVRTVEKPDEFRSIMKQERDAAILYIPTTSFITEETFARVCSESGFDKLIVWEVERLA